MNPTTDSQALLTKTFLHFIPFFFFFFVFSPVNCLCPTATPHHFSLFPINVQLPVNNLYSLYLSFYFFYLYNAIMQGSKSHIVTDSQSQKPKTKKKTQTVQFRLQRFSRTTQAPNQLKEKIHKHRSGKDKS